MSTRAYIFGFVVVVLAGLLFTFSDLLSQESKPDLLRLLSLSSDNPADEYNPEDPRFLVHEWGTFTSFAGSDGIKLEFHPLVHNDLPRFVVDRPRQSGIVPISELMAKQSFFTMERMETPVTYFYTPEEKDIKVKVGFPDGLLTEFYPPVNSIQPPLSETEEKLTRTFLLNGRPGFSQQQVAQVLKEESKNSELDWGTITLLPEKSLRPNLNNAQAADGIKNRLISKILPRDQENFDYYYARETDAAYIHSYHAPDEKLPGKPRGDFFEKFLFYRGIGNFSLPFKLVAKGEGAFEATNLGDQAISSLVLFHRNQEEGIRYSILEKLDAGETRKLTLPADKGNFKKLLASVEQSLVDAGLFRKEAASMVKTWKSSWFQEDGTRLFYLLPQSQTEELLPLTVQPIPDETVRVMVGRLEVMTPEMERKLEEILKKSTIPPLSENGQSEGIHEGLADALEEWGRFQEPALRRVQNVSTDAEVDQKVEQILGQL